MFAFDVYLFVLIVGFTYLCNSLIGCLRLVGECLLFVIDLGVWLVLAWFV